MTRRLAHTMIALLCAVIALQLVIGAILLHDQELTRKEAEAAQVSSMDTLEMQKQAAGRPSMAPTAAEPQDVRASR